jgi:hypothetical protein
MTTKTVCAAAFGALLMWCVTGPAGAHHVSIYGAKGNDTGGIIPWSPENELQAFDIAQNNCGRFNKFAALRSIRRVYGDYIVYDCRWDPPRRTYAVRHHRRVQATVDK